jgi:SRSO17 transposase
MAARAGEAGYDQLHHFVAAGVWASAPLEATLLCEADRLVGGSGAFLVIDDTAMPKKGRDSVGVAPHSGQYQRQSRVSGFVRKRAFYGVSKFSRYSDRSPERLGLEDVRAFQVYLVAQLISWPALNRRCVRCASFMA